MKNVQKKVGCVDFFTGRGKTGAAIDSDNVIVDYSFIQSWKRAVSTTALNNYQSRERAPSPISTT